MPASSGGLVAAASKESLSAGELHVLPLAGNFGVEIRDLDVANASDSELLAVLDALYENRFVVIRTNGLTKRQYVDFAVRLGDPIPLSRDPDFPEIAYITNRNVDTQKTMLGAAHWHTDQSFRNTVSSMTMLYSEHAPKQGGATRFCNMADAYATLPDETKERIEDLVVRHRHGKSVSARPGDHIPLPPKGWNRATTVYHPLVRRHPETGLKTLYAITGTSQGIKGVPDDEAQELLNDLCAHAFQDRFIAQHQHDQHDILLWDNPTTMHSATPIAAATGDDDLRLLRRISLRGSPPIRN